MRTDEAVKLGRIDPRRVETTIRELIIDFEGAVAVEIERRQALGAGDPAALEGVEYARRRLVEYVAGLVTPKT
jgi:hypothetical protein